MKPWNPSIDPTTIPDDVLRSEWGRRNNAKRKTKGAGPGRPRKIAPGDVIAMDAVYAENPPDGSGPRLTLDEWAAEAQAQISPLSPEDAEAMFKDLNGMLGRWGVQHEAGCRCAYCVGSARYGPSLETMERIEATDAAFNALSDTLDAWAKADAIVAETEARHGILTPSARKALRLAMYAELTKP